MFEVIGPIERKALGDCILGVLGVNSEEDGDKVPRLSRILLHSVGLVSGHTKHCR